MIKIVCKYCNRDFYTKPFLKEYKKYCSMKCRRAYEKKYLNITKRCITCKEYFTIPISKTARGWGKFCSRKCFHKWHREQMIGMKNPTWNSKKVKCYVCEKEIYRQKARIKKSKIFYCSRKCQHSVVDILYGGRKQYIRYHHQRRKALVRSGGELTINTILKVHKKNIKKYGILTCIYCMKKLTNEKATLEHKLPLARGGSNNIRNLDIACVSCNSRKKNRTEKEFRRII